MTKAKHGGAGRGQGRKRVQDPKREVLSQRYSEGEKRLIESVAGGEVGTFIHDAAVDRARQFSECHTPFDSVRDYIEDDEMGVA